MNKYFILLFLLFVTHLHAVEHLKFVGIPIDGQIADFQKKLIAKGFKYDKLASSDLPKGQRQFKGIYKSKDADVTVFYDRKSNNVYKVVTQVSTQRLATMQVFLDKTIKEIESFYIYESHHDFLDSTDLHFVYNILSRIEKKQIGKITVNPSTAYVFNNGKVVGTVPIIDYIYEDFTNTNSLRPGSTEPKGSLSLIQHTENFFLKNASWASNFKKHYCYDSYIERLTYLLDCFKYNYGVPLDFINEEETIENLILEAKTFYLGKIKTAYSREFANVYRFKSDDEDDTFIQFGVNSNWYNIRMQRPLIIEHIHEVGKLKRLFEEKYKFYRGRDYSEDTGITLSVYFGEDQLGDAFGNMKWGKASLKCSFNYREGIGPYIEVVNDYKPIFMFRNLNDFDEYIEILKKALL